MKTIRRAADRGHADHGWLQARHTFSFADYRDPAWHHFGVLRVINEDTVAPGSGFGTHGHRDMEILTWVLSGALQHKDSMGNGSVIRPGDAQLMSAGTGVTHSEFNASADEPVHLLQTWVFPARKDTEPSYGQRHVPLEERRGRFALLASPDGIDGSLVIGQQARVLTGIFGAAEGATYELTGARAWLHVARGAVTVDGERLEAGDGLGLEGVGAFEVVGSEDAGEVLLFDLAAP